MENCIVCVKSTENTLFRITVTSKEWIEKNMLRVIEKHLWWWYLKPESKNSVSWICRQCWDEIVTFHNFYTKVEKAHRNYQPVVSSLNKVKEEHEIVETTCVDLELVKASRKGRPPKIDKNVIDNFKDNTVDILEVKTEFCSSPFEWEQITEYNLNTFEESAINNAYNLQKADDSSLEHNEIESCEENPLESIQKQKKSNRKPKVSISKKIKNVQNKTKKKDNSKNKTIQFDNFFKESQHNLECCICNMDLPDFRSIKEHYRNEHNTRGYALCCGKKYFKRCLLVDHLRVHKDPNFFKCQFCSKTFETRRGLEMHLETHKVRERKYKCDECGKSYFKVHIFERHKLTHIPDCEKQFNCSQCDKKFASDDLRRRHEDLTHARKNAKICDICGKSFCYGYSFLRHMEEHAGVPQTKVTCDICGVKLTNKYGLKQHVKMRHLEENLQEQICPYCSKVSPNINAHRKHVKYSHTMLRKHACHLCEKAFRRPLELKEHLSTHTGEALYTCPHCPRTFISNANMYKHQKIAHQKEWLERRSKKINNNSAKSVLIAPFVDNNDSATKNPAEILDAIAPL